MSVTSRREREKEERRGAILDAAEKVFDDKGFESSKMGEIADVADLSKGTLYLYFKNKNDLFLAMSSRTFESVVSEFEKAEKNSAVIGLAKLKLLLKIYTKEMTGTPRRFRMAISWFAANKHIDDDTESFNRHQILVNKILQTLALSIEAAQENGDIVPEKSPAELAMHVWSAVIGGMLVFTKMDHVEKHVPGVINSSTFLNGFIDMQIAGLQGNPTRGHEWTHSRLLGTMTLIFVLSCRPHNVTRKPLPTIDVAKKYSQASPGQSNERWWLLFKDEELTRLIGVAFTHNFDLQSAWSRLKQSNAMVVQAKSGAWPELTTNLGASRSKSRLNFGNSLGGGGNIPSSFELDVFDASLAASYELDVWRKADSKVKSSILDARAIRDDVESIAMTVAASLAESWYRHVAQEITLDVVLKQAELSETLLKLATLRLEQGFGSAGDIYQQEQQLISVKSKIPQIEASLFVLKNQIALLCGQDPLRFQLQQGKTFPTIPPLPQTGLPADLLDKRPDVRASRKRVEAADYGVAVAVAQRLPSLRLTASAGYQENELPKIFDGFIWRLAGNLLGPIFDRGRRKAEVSRNKAVVLERLAHYSHTYLKAIVEVENASFQEQKQNQIIDFLKRQQIVGEASLREARSKYQTGVSDVGYLSVLTAVSSLQNTEVALVEAIRQQISYRVRLYRALGGAWSQAILPIEKKIEK